MAQPGPSDYRTVEDRRNTEGIMDQATETARDIGERASGVASDITSAIRERPYTTLAVAAGLAFAAGALWKLGHRREPTPWETLASKIPDMPNAPDWLRRYYR